MSDDPTDHADDPDATDTTNPTDTTDATDATDRITLTPIGVVRSPFATTSDAPRQGFIGDREGTIELADEYGVGLTGIDGGDRVVVVWYADETDEVVQLSDGRGVFGTRAPARPNPVCITTVEVLSVDRAGPTLRVRGVDMRDGTPVLDLKRTLDPERAGRERPPGE